MPDIDRIVIVWHCKCCSVTYWYRITMQQKLLKTSINVSIRVKCVILLIETAIRTILCIISMARFPSNCDVILYQRCGKTNLIVCINTFSVITGPCYVTLLSISIPKTITIYRSRAETFGLYLHPTNVQTTKFASRGQVVHHIYVVLCYISHSCQC